MPKPLRLPAALLLTLAASCTCNRGQSPQPPPPPPAAEATPAAPPEARAAPAGPPATASSSTESIISDRSVLYQLAIYHLPRPKTPVRPVVEELVKKSFPNLYVGDKPSRDMKLPVVFVVPMSTKEYTPPSEDYLRRLGRGLTDEDKRRIQASEEATMLNTFTDPPGLDVLRQSTALALEVARRTGGLIWDESTSETFTPDRWEQKRLKHWSNGFPVAQDYLTIYMEEKGSTLSLATRGMGNFALPDLIVETTDRAMADMLGSLINLTAQALVEQGTLAYDGKLTIDLDAFKNELYRKAWAATSPDLPRKVEVQLSWRKRDEEDDKNRLLRLTAAESVARQVAAIERGSKVPARDPIFSVKPGKGNLEETSRRALERLQREIKPLFLRGLGDDAKLFVKAGFKTPDKNKEFMWLEVKDWRDKSLHGVLINQPDHVPGLELGSSVTVSEADLFDYLLIRRNGQNEGGETDKLIQEQGEKDGE